VVQEVPERSRRHPRVHEVGVRDVVAEDRDEHRQTTARESAKLVAGALVRGGRATVGAREEELRSEDAGEGVRDVFDGGILPRGRRRSRNST
jgi:hypothetical protein